MTNSSSFILQVANPMHVPFSEQICNQMAESAKQRGTGIAYRSPEYISQKMEEGKAIIAFHVSGVWAGFCYIETWSHGQFVANSGLIVHPDYRKEGLARMIKKRVFELSRELYPEAKIFGLTTGLAVMKINSELGYEPVTYSELTQDENFWSGCQSCVNYDILMAKERKVCMCTAMLFDPKDHEKPKKDNFAEDLKKRYSLYERWMKFKTLRLSNIRILKDRKNGNGNQDSNEEKTIVG